MRFEVAAGSSPYWFSVLIKYVSGAGDLKAVEIRQVGRLLEIDHLSICFHTRLETRRPAGICLLACLVHMVLKWIN